MSDLDVKIIRQNLHLTQGEFAQLLGITKRTIQNWEAGGVIPESKSEILHRYKKQALSSKNDRLVVVADKEEEYHIIKKVPYYDIDVTATIAESFSDIKEEPEFYVDFKPFNDCTAYLPVFGDSMYPSYASGEIVAVKEVRNRDAIYWGETYLIITNSAWDNMRTLKQLHFHEDNSKVILRASNPNFKGDTVIPKEAIVSLYIVKGKITRKQL